MRPSLVSLLILLLFVLRCFAAFRQSLPASREEVSPKRGMAADLEHALQAGGPAACGLSACLALLRHPGTFANYCGYVRTGCLLLGVSADVFDAPEIARAKRAIAARGLHAARPKMWIRRDTLEKIVEWCDARPDFKAYGMLYLAAYAFLLRLPSEVSSARGWPRDRRRRGRRCSRTTAHCSTF